MSDGKHIVEQIKQQVEEYQREYKINNVWFRGEYRLFKIMIPSMYRNMLPEEEICNPKRSFLNHIEQETILEYENWLRNKIIERSTHTHHDGYTTTSLKDWGIVFYEQHYGLPTRFLDWTYAIETALYFATQNDGECDAKLWLLDPCKLNELTRDAYELRQANSGEYERFLMLHRYNAAQQLPVAITANAPSSANRRIYNQRGTFVFTGLRYINFREFVHDTVLEKGVDESSVLYGITIPAADCQKIRDYLDKECGINNDTLGLSDGNHLTELYSFKQFIGQR
ncbi:FRG domain-containing protein [Brevibacterium sp. PAMC23299]|nr:FRG domain-containing protein [Brevibacterium sp. PAMC23299]